MNLRKSLVSSIAAVGLLLGMTGGIVSAQLPTDDMDEAVLNVVCAPAASVDVELSSAFEVDLMTPGPYSDTVADGSVITVDMTCNDTEGWVVGTSITPFQFQGTAPAGKLQNFPGNHFAMNNGGLTSYTPGPTHGAGDAPPIPNIFVVLPNVPVFNIALTTNLLFFDWAAPGISVATWDSQLIAAPSNLAVGTYEAELTVVLYVP